MFSFHICFIYVNFTCANVKYILHTCKLFLTKYKISGNEIQKVTGHTTFVCTFRMVNRGMAREKGF